MFGYARLIDTRRACLLLQVCDAGHITDPMQSHN